MPRVGGRETHFSAALSRMMVEMIFTVVRSARPDLQLSLLFLLAGMNPAAAFAQVDYSVHFELEKPTFQLGEPIFCRYVIRNTGGAAFSFRYRSPTRNLATDYTQDPQFQVKDVAGKPLPDAGPRPCGSPQGTAVYGSVTLPPGKDHTERWLLNQWAQFSAAGTYHLRAERRLALFPIDPQTENHLDKPAAFALAIDEFSFQVVPSTPAQVEAAFHPYLTAIANPKDPDPAEAVTVLTSMPQPFFLDQLVGMLKPGKPDRWDRRDVVNGLARLDTPASWKAILKLFQEGDAAVDSGSKNGDEDPLRSYALLVLAEKGDSAFLPVLLEMLSKSAEPLRGDILRALGFFHDAQAFQPLFDNLHSTRMTDRMDAILGLKNLGTKEVVPALLAELNDTEAPVEQVANFALEGLTGHEETLSANPTREEFQRAAVNWHAWWRENAATFSPPKPAACHDW